jgi:O-antigen/teichoic acid export membrane protein
MTGGVGERRGDGVRAEIWSDQDVSEASRHGPEPAPTEVASKSACKATETAVRSVEHQRSMLRSVRSRFDDPLLRTATLLITDNVALAAFGAGCTVIATRSWSTQAVGAVAAVSGGLNILVVTCALGMPSTVIRFLRAESNQRRLMRQAWTATSALAIVSALVVSAIPGHLGIPLASLGIPKWLIPLTATIYVVANVIVTVGDPAYTARQEVGFMVAKDVTASLVRIALLLALSGRGTSALWIVMLVYTATAACIDLVLVSRRLTRAEAEAPRRRRFGLIRQHSSFAAGNQLATVIATAPTFALPAVVAALVNTRSAAFVAVPLQIAGLLTVIASMTGQSLLSELARVPEKLLQTATRAVCIAYAATLVAAGALAVAAPYILLAFGSDYSTHGTAFLRWLAAGSFFFVFNYIADITLLAQRKVSAYVFVNTAGTAALLGLVFLGLSNHGLEDLGPAWFAGQAVYAVLAALTLIHYMGLSGVGRALVVASRTVRAAIRRP